LGLSLWHDRPTGLPTAELWHGYRKVGMGIEKRAWLAGWPNNDPLFSYFGISFSN
jgi:hypothetical protein